MSEPPQPSNDSVTIWPRHRRNRKKWAVHFIISLVGNTGSNYPLRHHAIRQDVLLAAKIGLILTFGANSDLFAALVSFCVSVVRGFVVRPLFSLFQATYRFKSARQIGTKRWKIEQNKHYFLRVPCGGEGGK